MKSSAGAFEGLRMATLVLRALAGLKIEDNSEQATA
jgi:hypothetical protein